LQCFPEGFFSEEHAVQIQPRSGAGVGHKRPVTGGQYLGCPGAVPSALPVFEYVRTEYPYHVVQDTGTDDDEIVSVYCADEVETVDVPHFMVDFGFGT